MSPIKSLVIDLFAIAWTSVWASTIGEAFQLASFILGFLFLSVRFIVYVQKNRKYFKWFKKPK